MPHYLKSSKHYRVSYVTGAKHVLLGLLIDTYAAGDISTMASLGTTGACNQGSLDLEKIRKGVSESIAKDHKSFGTHYAVRKIQYLDNDTPDYSLYAHCAYLIVKGIQAGIQFQDVGE